MARYLGFLFSSSIPDLDGGEDASDPEMLRDTGPQRSVYYDSNYVKFSKTLIIDDRNQISHHLGMGWGKGKMERL